MDNNPNGYPPKVKELLEYLHKNGGFQQSMLGRLWRAYVGDWTHHIGRLPKTWNEVTEEDAETALNYLKNCMNDPMLKAIRMVLIPEEGGE